MVLSTEGVKGKSLELSMGPSALSNKTYHFDKVFSSAADQAMIYDDVVTPILDEVGSADLEVANTLLTLHFRCSQDTIVRSLHTARQVPERRTRCLVT